MMWEAFRDRIAETGGEVRMEQRVRKIHRDDRAVRAVEVENAADGSSYVFSADQFISSMPLAEHWSKTWFRRHPRTCASRRDSSAIATS